MHRLFGIVLLLGSMGLGWLWIDYRQFSETPLDIPSEGVVYLLPAGGSAASLARDLERLGMVRRPLYLQFMARIDGRAQRLQAGEYRILPGTLPAALLELLTSGRVIQHPVTLVEGWTFREILATLKSNERLSHTLDGLSPAEIMARLGRPELNPEGRFFPDTYHFPRGTRDLAVLRRALEAMDRTLALEWDGRSEGLPLGSPEQALTLASIVEKETGLPEERPLIAGVFVRRLRLGMKLQTDPTVIYGLGEGFDGNLRRADLVRDTPYNTYVRNGLPPTPIAMPGVAAIRAVLHPAEGDSLYFVARGDGSHQFSATLEEHNRAVRRFQLGRR